ncbi:hypothetical protein Leryth_011836 [Lithospermum erythrorhizon]|uniref:Late embryogenesis abundant protein LEA-2 subgroup domain-containing protein n=1 Tax=Lithospermum erythrorhizon TaxID=34254 RepID=A0AAV3QZT7_LITER|nr:hypothetical protein Leryth_011836 [Lithospermum erythrorhizon]
MARVPSLPLTIPQKPPSHKKRKKCCMICGWCLIFIIMATLLVIFIGCILLLCFVPRLPIIRLSSIQFKKLNVSHSAKGQILDSKIEIKVQVSNPNSKLQMKYARTKVSMTSMRGTRLGVGIITGFVQERNNVTHVKMTLSSKVTLNRKQVRELRKAKKDDKDLDITADISTGIGTGYGSWTTGTLRVDVHCGFINLEEVEDGSTPECKVKVLNW